MNLNKFKMLVQREIWEHKAPLLWTPLLISALLIVLFVSFSIYGVSHINDGALGNIAHHLDDGRVTAADLAKEVENLNAEKLSGAWAVILTISKAPFDLLLLFLLPFYCVSSFFDERKDRSIYFWRSLPVSDFHSLLAKLTTVVLVYPALALLAAMALQLVILLLTSLFVIKSGFSAWAFVLQPSNYLTFVVNSYFDYVLMMLWSLPFVGLLMLIACATRRPYVWAILPWPLVALVEKWVFGSHHFASWIAQRVQGTFAILFNDVKRIADSGDIELLGSNQPFGDWMSVLAHGQFWFGIALGVALFVAAIRVRRRIQDV